MLQNAESLETFQQIMALGQSQTKTCKDTLAVTAYDLVKIYEQQQQQQQQQPQNLYNVKVEANNNTDCEF